MMRPSAHEFFAHQAYRIVAARRHQLRHAFLARFTARNLEEIAALCTSHDKLHLTRVQNDFTDRLASSLAQFDVDLSATQINELKDAAAYRFLDAPIQLRGQPTGKEHGCRSESGCEFDACVFDVSEAMMRCRVIEELGKREADPVQPRPIQVTKHDTLFRFHLRGLNQSHLRVKIFPRLTVVDHPIDPRPKLPIHRLTKLALPPKIKRQVRIEVREYDAGQQIRTRSFEQK